MINWILIVCTPTWAIGDRCNEGPLDEAHRKKHLDHLIDAQRMGSKLQSRVRPLVTETHGSTERPTRSIRMIPTPRGTSGVGAAGTGESVALGKIMKREGQNSQRSFTPDTGTLGAMGTAVKHYKGGASILVI